MKGCSTLVWLCHKLSADLTDRIESRGMRLPTFRQNCGVVAKKERYSLIPFSFRLRLTLSPIDLLSTSEMRVSLLVLEAVLSTQQYFPFFDSYHYHHCLATIIAN